MGQAALDEQGGALRGATPRVAWHRCARLLAPAVLAWLAACGSLELRPSIDTAAVDRFAARGYAAPNHLAVVSEPITWSRVDRDVPLQLTRPAAAGRFPVVLYLPGLGQHSDAGARWTVAWAQAGYAVLAIQPLDADANAWTSALARRGEFDAIARRQFGGAQSVERLRELGAILDFVKARVAASDGRFAALDLTRVAVAGYDLGAYTAMTLDGAGIGAPGFPPDFPPDPAAGAALAGMLPLRAVIALSPYPGAGPPPAQSQDRPKAQPQDRTPDQPPDPAQDRSQAQRQDQPHDPPHAHFERSAGPVLWVTGRDDTDAYGLVADAALRAAPFALLPPGDKYLLLLAEGSHALIGGADVVALLADRNAEGGPAHPLGATRQRGPGGQGGGQGGNGRQRSQGPNSARSDDQDPDTGSDANAENSPAAIARRKRLAAELSATMTRWAQAAVAEQAVTTAFLDAYLRGDPAARTWLQHAAGNWLADGASLSWH